MTPANLFPNGFASWVETFTEITLAFGAHLAHNQSKSKIVRLYGEHGRGIIYTEAEMLAHGFEELYAGHLWDGEFSFFDAVDAYLEEWENDKPHVSLIVDQNKLL
jgi:hypothetical protein